MIDYEKRAMIEAEDKYTFRQSSQISSQTGLIGYLRTDMDTDGNGFFSSWNDYRKDLKTDEFKQEFDEVINSLREEGDILHNRKDLAYYCYTNPQSKMPTEQDYYGVRVDTDKYTYLLRLNPNKGEYNLYCYCYVKDVPFPVSWTVKMKKKQKETQDILSYHTQAAGCSDKARAKASGGRQPIEECGRTGL